MDKSKILRTPKGGMPKNARVYAGNTYYFNPALNRGLAARLKNNGNKITLKKPPITLTEEDLIAFPYGKDVVEGALTTQENNMYY